MRTEQARTILKRFDYRLLKQTNICVGTAVIYKDNKWRLQIYLRDQLDSHKHLLNLRFGEVARLAKKEEKEISKNELVPELVVVKKFKPFEYTEKYRPCLGGVSIGHYLVTAGSFGVIVYRGQNRFILSNKHVFAPEEESEIGDPILQPGVYDGGINPDDKIGTLEDFVEIKFNNPDDPNYVDAAICKPTDEADILDSILELNGLTDVVEIAEVIADRGEPVIKVGRTTEKTEGFILGFSGLVAVDYGVGIAYFDDQIVTGYMGAPGDSGSFLYSKCGKRSLGLLFAGSEELGLIIYNRATQVEELLDVKFAPVRRLPTMASRIAGQVVDLVRKICLHCCCWMEWPPPLPPPGCILEVPFDVGCYSSNDDGCEPCSIEYCTSGESPSCPPLCTFCGSSSIYGCPPDPYETEYCIYEVVDVYCVEPSFCYCVYDYASNTCPIEVPGPEPYDGT